MRRCITCRRIIWPWQHYGLRVYRLEFGWYGHSTIEERWHRACGERHD